MKKQKFLQAGLPATPSQASPLAKQSEAARGSGLRGGRGQTLLEILLAFSVSILVLSAIIVGITTSLSNTQYTKNQNLANSYAQEGMAIVRRTRDSNWTNFYSKAGDYCLDQNSIILTSPSPPPQNCGQKIGIFMREVSIEHSSSDCSAGTPPTPTPIPSIIPRGSKVTVKVSWSDSKCPVGTPYCHKVELLTCFSNTDQKQTP